MTTRIFLAGPARYRVIVAVALVVFAVAWTTGCAGGDHNPSDDGDDFADDVDDDSDSTDDDSTDDDADDDGADDDGADDDDTETSIFDHPHDGRLYAAAGSAIITPDDDNHPCLQTLGGTSYDRRATGTHDDLELRFLLLERNGEHFVLVSGDLIGLRLPDAELVMDALEPYGVDRDHFVFTSTHSHEAPDTVGIWGKNILRTGRCPAYIDFLVNTVAENVVALAAQMVPVSAEAAGVTVEDPFAPNPDLMSDSRRPDVKNRNLTVARLFDDTGATVATLVNWHCHPEVMIWSSEYSADFPRWVRRRMDEIFGGTCVYVSGTVGGLLNPFDAPVPQYTADGEPVLDGDHPVYIGDGSETNAWSLGYAIGDFAVTALASASPLEPTLFVETTEVEIPVTNIVIVLAIEAGLVPAYNEMDLDHPAVCGAYGCFVQTLQHVRIGDLHLVAVPGEGFSESSVGRPESVFDFGSPWGVSDFPAMPGYRAALPPGDLLIDMGLANNEIGYIVPLSDIHPSNHPDYYEEKYDISPPAERIVREALTELISDGAR